MDQDKPQTAVERHGYSRRLQFPVFWRILITFWSGAVAAVLLTHVTDTWIAIVWVSLIAILLAYRFSSPLKEMAIAARLMAAGRVDQRVAQNIANRRDEAGALAHSLNLMANRQSTVLQGHQLMLSNVAHDLQTPIARQRVAIDRMEEGDANPALLAIVQRQNTRMDAITRDVLAFYQIGEDARDRGHEATRIIAVVNQVLGHATEYAELRRVDCRLDVDAGAREALVLGDRALIHRAIEKVLQNALDYSTPGQMVTVHLESTGNEVICAIADKGPGVAEASLPRLFEPFFREDSARSGDGLGLGLAIAHTIMQAHAGRIEVENEAHGGLMVRLVFPVFN